MYRYLSSPSIVASYELQSLCDLDPNTNTAFSQNISLSMQCNGIVHAICMWYEVDLGDESISTGPSDDPTHHWRQAAFLVSEPKEVTVEEVISCRVVIDTTCGVFCNIIEQ